MRGKWSVSEIPHKGWSCIEIEDLGEITDECEMCESQEIRYVHFMQHADYGEILRVGCVCAGHMEENMVAAEARDYFMKLRRSKRMRWVQRKWKKSQKGNEYIKSDGFIITIFYKSGNWAAHVKQENSDEVGIFSRRKYINDGQAKLAAYDYITKLLSQNVQI